MEFRIIINGVTREIDLDFSRVETGEEYLVSFKGESEKIKIVVLRRQKERIVISISDKVYTIFQQARSRSSLSFTANGKIFEASRESDKLEKEEASRLATSKELIVSNFPAKIVKLRIKPGDSLNRGETLIVLEAMKMEAQIKVPRDCTVEDVFVKEGEMIERGKPMVRLKFR